MFNNQGRHAEASEFQVKFHTAVLNSGLHFNVASGVHYCLWCINYGLV